MGGPVVTPPVNMLYYFKATWNPNLSPSKFLHEISEISGGMASEELVNYYKVWEIAFKNGLLFCNYPVDMYSDYRWLPENASRFGYQHSLFLQKGSDILSPWSKKLSILSTTANSSLSKQIFLGESKLARFHSDELATMAKQAKAMYYLGSFWAKRKRGDLRRAKYFLKVASNALKENFKKTKEFLPKTAYYWEINKWFTKEMDKKQ